MQAFDSEMPQVMDFLIKGIWYEQDAARLGIRLSQAKVTATLNQQRQANYPTTAQYEAFLAETGQTQTDERLRVVLYLDDEALIKKLGSESKVNAQVEKLFKPRTQCAPAFQMDDCTKSSGSDASTTASPDA